MKKFKTLAIAGSMALPFIGLAQAGRLDNIVLLVQSAGNLVNVLIGFVIALATLVFMWGLIQYIASSDPEKQKSAKGYMAWGLIGLFVMVSVWGLVKFIQGAFFGGDTIDTAPLEIPSIPIPGVNP